MNGSTTALLKLHRSEIPAKDVLRRLPDTAQGQCAIRQFMTVFGAMAGQHIDALRAGIHRQFDIVGMIADDKRACKVKFVCVRSPEEKKGSGLIHRQFSEWSCGQT